MCQSIRLNLPNRLESVTSVAKKHMFAMIPVESGTKNSRRVCTVGL